MFDSLFKKEVWLNGIEHVKKRDGKISELINEIGSIKITKHTNYFGTLVASIISQQISWAAAISITKRLKSLYGRRMPLPEEFLLTSRRKLSSLGLSPQKISYIKDLSHKVKDGRVELKKFYKLPNETVIKELDGVKGIGRWTAEMFLIFSLGRTDVLPRDDLGIKNGIHKLYGLRKEPDKKKFDELEGLWHPFSSVASIYIWEYSGGGIE